MRVIEKLLNLDATDPKSSLDETQITRLQHILRAQGGEHGSILADRLGEETDAPAKAEKPVAEKKPA